MFVQVLFDPLSDLVSILCESPQVSIVIFGFSHFPIGAGNRSKQAAQKTAQTVVLLPAVESLTPAQVYDLAHQRRLKGLQFYIDEGYPLNVAARLVEAPQ